MSPNLMQKTAQFGKNAWTMMNGQNGGRWLALTETPNLLKDGPIQNRKMRTRRDQARLGGA